MRGILNEAQPGVSRNTGGGRVPGALKQRSCVTVKGLAGVEREGERGRDSVCPFCCRANWSADSIARNTRSSFSTSQPASQHHHHYHHQQTADGQANQRLDTDTRIQESSKMRYRVT